MKAETLCLDTQEKAHSCGRGFLASGDGLTQWMWDGLRKDGSEWWLSRKTHLFSSGWSNGLVECPTSRQKISVCGMDEVRGWWKVFTYWMTGERAGRRMRLTPGWRDCKSPAGRLFRGFLLFSSLPLMTLSAFIFWWVSSVWWSISSTFKKHSARGELQIM